MSDGNNRNNFGGQGNYPEPIKHALNDFAFRVMGTRPLEGGTRPPSLGFDVRRDGILFRAYTNVTGDKDKGEIKAYLHYQYAMMVPILLERAVSFAPGKSQDLIIANENWDRQANKRVPRHALTLRFGRNDRGVVYLGIESWENTRPKIYLDMVPSSLIKMAEAGHPVAVDQVSELMALAWARSFMTLLPAVYAQQYVPPKPKKDGGNSGGGNNGGGYGGGGNNNQGGGYGGSSNGGGYGGNSGGGGGYGGYGDGDDLP